MSPANLIMRWDRSATALVVRLAVKRLTWYGTKGYAVPKKLWKQTKIKVTSRFNSLKVSNVKMGWQSLNFYLIRARIYLRWRLHAARWRRPRASAPTSSIARLNWTRAQLVLKWPRNFEQCEFSLFSGEYLSITHFFSVVSGNITQITHCKPDVLGSTVHATEFFSLSLPNTSLSESGLKWRCAEEDL